MAQTIVAPRRPHPWAPYIQQATNMLGQMMMMKQRQGFLGGQAEQERLQDFQMEGYSEWEPGVSPADATPPKSSVRVKVKGRDVILVPPKARTPKLGRFEHGGIQYSFNPKTGEATPISGVSKETEDPKSLTEFDTWHKAFEKSHGRPPTAKEITKRKEGVAKAGAPSITQTVAGEKWPYQEQAHIASLRKGIMTSKDRETFLSDGPAYNKANVANEVIYWGTKYIDKVKSTRIPKGKQEEILREAQRGNIKATRAPEAIQLMAEDLGVEVEEVLKDFGIIK